MDNVGRVIKHKQFWNRTNKAPLKGYCYGSYFVSKRFKAIEKLLTTPRKIQPEDFIVDDFVDDYLKAYETWENNNSEMFYSAEPFTGIPWMEAILGCDVFSTKNSFIAEPKDVDICNVIAGEIVNEGWYNKFIEFTYKLNELSQGRFPISQPIMRGPTDVLGTLLGQEQLVFAFFDYPEKVVSKLQDITELFLNIMKDQKKHINRFYDGYSIGFYNVWCPDDCIWFQDDLSALISPDLYTNYVTNCHARISSCYEYSLMHIHPASFFLIDAIIDISSLKCVEVNKDVGGPAVEEMLPIFAKILRKKNLVLWGDFNKDEVKVLENSLDPKGLCIVTVQQ